MNKQNKIILIFAAILIFFILIFAILDLNVSETGLNYDNFAKCITERGAVMYGAETCSHCKEQKKTFGNSFKYVNYVECPDNINLCLEKGIDGYPTWLIGTSTRVIGFDKNSTMQEISDATGCLLPK